MKARNRSAFITVLTASLGLVAALLAGGCAEADDTDAGQGGSEPASIAGGEEGVAEDVHVGEEANHVDLLTHPLGCRCPVCTGGRATVQ